MLANVPMEDQIEGECCLFEDITKLANDKERMCVLHRGSCVALIQVVRGILEQLLFLWCHPSLFFVLFIVSYAQALPGKVDLHVAHADGDGEMTIFAAGFSCKFLCVNNSSESDRRTT